MEKEKQNTPTQLGAVATAYFDETRPKFSIGYEKYVATDGEHCIFVKSDYSPKPGEQVFHLKVVNNGVARNGVTQCQFYKGYEVEDEELKSRIAVVATDVPLVWRVTDAETGVKVEFIEGLYEETKRVSVPGAVDNGPAAVRVPRILAAFANMAKEADLYTCDKAERKSAIEKIGIVSLDNKGHVLQESRENFVRWGTLIMVFNGHWFLDWEKDKAIARTILQAEVGDFLDRCAKNISVQPDTFIATLCSLSKSEAIEVLRIVKHFWEGGAEWDMTDWVVNVSKYAK